MHFCRYLIQLKYGEDMKRNWKKSLRRLAIALSAMLFLLLFQNCGKFDVRIPEANLNSSLGTSTTLASTTTTVLSPTTTLPTPSTTTSTTLPATTTTTAFPTTTTTSYPGVADITVDVNTKFQTMLGWEAMNRAWEIDKGNNKFDASWLLHYNTVADRMVNELGINRFMMSIQSGWLNPTDYWSQFVNGQLSYTEWGQHIYEVISANPRIYQFSEFDFYVETMLLPMKQKTEANGDKFYVTISFGDFGNAGTSNIDMSINPTEYANFILVYFDRLKNKYGITADALNLINEPENSGAPARWTGTRIGQALLAVQAKLNAAGYTKVNYIGPSVTNAANAIPWMDALSTITGALQKLTTLSYHRYGLTNFTTLSNYAKARGLQTAMTEYYPANVNALIEDLTVMNVSTWQKWGVIARAGGSNSGYYLTDIAANPSSPKFYLSPDVAQMSAYFKYVRLNAVRVDAKSTSSAFLPIAFVNSNGKQVLVIKTNSGVGTKSIKIVGLKSGTYGVRTVTYSENIATQPNVTTALDGSIVLNVSDGLTTLHGL